MLHAGGGDDYVHDADGWTLRTADGSRAAHAEHTIAITDDGPVILTAPLSRSPAAVDDVPADSELVAVDHTGEATASFSGPRQHFGSGLQRGWA
jgi:hypothetical protein